MGGKGAGHKSVKALLSRQANMQKARAARRRPPLPWRSGMESRVIEQLVWQWFQSSDKWRVTSDEQAKTRQQQVPRTVGMRPVRNDVRRDSGSREGAASSAPTTVTANRAVGRVNPAPTNAGVQLGTRQIIARA